MVRIHIDKNELQRLYLSEEKSAQELAKTYNVSITTIISRLREYGVKTRTPKEDKKRRDKLKKQNKMPQIILPEKTEQPTMNCIWDIFDDEFQQQRRFNEKLRNARSV